MGTQKVTRKHLKKEILVQDQGGAELQPAGILKYSEELKQGSNAEIGPKDFFEMPSINVVIDTNVLISALLFDGIPGELIPLWQESNVVPLISKEIMFEYIRVLAYPKFNLSEKEIQYLMYEQVLPFFQVVEVVSGPLIIQEDPSDDKFIHCAIAGHADAIVTGDSHLLSLKRYHNIRIMTPSELLTAITDAPK